MGRGASSEEPRADESCEARLARETPTALRASLVDLGYDDFEREACLLEAAELTGEVATCDDLALPISRASCRRRIAITHHRPDECPSHELASTHERGHEPLCLALASRAPRLCRALVASERLACEAMLGVRTSRCVDAVDRPHCERLVARWAPTLGVAAEARPATTPDAHELELTLFGEPLVVTDVLARGAVLEDRGGRRWLRIGTRLALELTAAEAPRASVWLEVPIDGAPPITEPLSLAGATLELRLAGRSELRIDRGTITLTRFDPTLGGDVEGTLDLFVARGGHRSRARGTFRTFVRDLVTLTEPAAPPGDVLP